MMFVAVVEVTDPTPAPPLAGAGRAGGESRRRGGERVRGKTTQK